jgi:hypothetical protein
MWHVINVIIGTCILCAIAWFAFKYLVNNDH